MANKKLFTEIERTLKKCNEGIANYDEIHRKIQDSPNHNIRERLETDLKKEIKRLQKYRDTIKQWANNDVIKDKSNLRAMRKLIEERMESFKKCEKETKTKPYSKEALRLKMEEAAAAAHALNPEQQEANDWIEEQMTTLREQIETLDAELEKINNRNTKKRKKREEPQEEVVQMTERLEKNKWHLVQLKRCQERITNDEVDPMLYKEIQDDVEYYIESYEDDVLYHVDEMYHPITEAEEEVKLLGRRLIKPTDPEEDEIVVTVVSTSKKDKDKKDEKTKSKDKEKKEKKQKRKSKDRDHQERSKKKKNHKKSKIKDSVSVISSSSRDKSRSVSKKSKQKHSPSVSSVNSFRSDHSTSTVATNKTNTNPTAASVAANGPPHLTAIRLPEAMKKDTSSSSLKHDAKNISQQLLQQPLNTTPSNKFKKYTKILNESSESLTNGSSYPNHNHLHHSSSHQESSSSRPHPPSSSHAATVSASSHNSHGQSQLDSHNLRPVMPPMGHPPHQTTMDRVHSDPMPSTQHRTKPPKHHNTFVSSNGPPPGNISGSRGGGGGDGGPLLNGKDPSTNSSHSVHSPMKPSSHSASASNLGSSGGMQSTTDRMHHPHSNHSTSNASNVPPHGQHAHSSHAVSSSSTATMLPPHASHPGSLSHASSHGAHSSSQRLTSSKSKPPPMTESQSWDNLYPHPPPTSVPTMQSASSDGGGGGGGGGIDYGLPPFSRTLTPEEEEVLGIIELGFSKRPQPMDTHEPSFYKPDHPFVTPGYFPKERRRMFDSPHIFTMMDLDTLFFIFYYQSASYQQFMAAKELKVRGWSYNTKFSAWFQRHYSKKGVKEGTEGDDEDGSSPMKSDLAKNETKSLKGKGQHIIVGGKYEKGTYIFFSRDSSWQMRMRENFKFDYSCLEDDKAVNVDDKLDWNKLATYGNGCGLIYGEQKQAMRYQQHQQRKQNAALSRSKQQQISQIQSKSRRQQLSSSSSKSGNSSTSRSMMRGISGKGGPPPHSLNASQPPPSSSSSSSKMMAPPMSMTSSKGRYTNSSSHSHPTRPPTSFHHNASGSRSAASGTNPTSSSGSNNPPPGRLRPPMQHYRPSQQYQSGR